MRVWQQQRMLNDRRAERYMATPRLAPGPSTSRAVPATTVSTPLDSSSDFSAGLPENSTSSPRLTSRDQGQATVFRFPSTRSREGASEVPLNYCDLSLPPSSAKLAIASGSSRSVPASPADCDEWDQGAANTNYAHIDALTTVAAKQASDDRRKIGHRSTTSTATEQPSTSQEHSLSSRLNRGGSFFSKLRRRHRPRHSSRQQTVELVATQQLDAVSERPSQEDLDLDRVSRRSSSLGRKHSAFGQMAKDL